VSRSVGHVKRVSRLAVSLHDLNLLELDIPRSSQLPGSITVHNKEIVVLVDVVN
jgi:hypothetical protein